jgi:hypothetical protein
MQEGEKMRQDQWDKLKRLLAPSGRETCPCCQKEITVHTPAEEITYAKTRNGTHLFIHEKCLSARGGKND